ncbi:hypothetical protein PF005_g10133 [Phytophthora fragariae]|uniref:Uncharacterized protein n=1 Tax=Phytophthora fragariae TaxID=53985 RepID=A0A6A3Y7P5_9STRA|nr:hypothetical protein PF005_g10133 [Phytophthora fragariae]
MFILLLRRRRRSSVFVTYTVFIPFTLAFNLFSGWSSAGKLPSPYTLRSAVAVAEKTRSAASSPRVLCASVPTLIKVVGASPPPPMTCCESNVGGD